MLLRRVLVFVCFTACDAQEPAAGARLRPITLRADGVPAWTVGWQDTELGVPCRVLVASDGERRCLPDSNVLYAQAFADAACTRELYLGPETSCGEAPSSFAYATNFPATCDVRSELVELEPADVNLPLFHGDTYQDGRRLCTPLDERASSALRTQVATRALWQRKQVVDPGRFVRAVGEERSRGTPTQVFDVMEDGARIRRELRDAGDESCQLAAYAEGALCLGAQPIPTGEYGDETCTTPAYLGTTNACGASTNPRRIVERSARCDEPLPHVRVYNVDARNGVTYGGAPGMCTAGTSTRAVSVRGSQLDFGSLPRVELVREGEARLEALSFVDDRGDSLGVAQLWDRELALVCTPQRATDGSLRCLPRAQGGEFFADAACTQRRMGVSCDEPLPGMPVSMFGAACGRARVLRAGERGLSPRFGFSSLAGSTACTSLSAFLGPRGAEPVPSQAIGDELPPALFAPIERVVP